MRTLAILVGGLAALAIIPACGKRQTGSAQPVTAAQVDPADEPEREPSLQPSTPSPEVPALPAEPEPSPPTAMTLERSSATTEPATPVEPYVCGERPNEGIPLSAHEPLLATQPCWTNEAAVVQHAQAEAKLLAAELADGDEEAERLRDAEATACEGIDPAELTHTPFAHTSDILSVEQVREGEVLLGARISFRKVDGLSANWLRQAIACSHARAAALDYDDTYFAYDPSVLITAKSMVEEEFEAFVIRIVGDPADAELIWKRAEELGDGIRQARR